MFGLDRLTDDELADYATEAAKRKREALERMQRAEQHGDLTEIAEARLKLNAAYMAAGHAEHELAQRRLAPTGCN